MTELRGDAVVLRPMEAADAEALRAIHETPEVTAWWGAMDDHFPFDEPQSTRFTILVDGRLAGLIQYGAEDEPDYRHAWIDIFLAPDVHGRGIGTDAVRTLAEHLHGERGYHRITIDPAVDNTAAVVAYEKAGFRRIGVMEASWRDPAGVWRDSLLMERVVRLTSGQPSP
jgi:aminoglycoside 6'-N-acetyltransferase